MALLGQPDLALLVRQRRPKSINETVSITLDTESHMLMMGQSMCYANSSLTVSNNTQSPGTHEAAVKVKQDIMIDLICALSSHLDGLEKMISAGLAKPECARRLARGNHNRRSSMLVTCGKCGKYGHFMVGCAANRCVGTDAIAQAQLVTDARNLGTEDRLPKSITEQILRDQFSNDSNIVKLSAVTPTCAYHVTGEFSKGKLRFMIDTGAAVSLIRETH